MSLLTFVVGSFILVLVVSVIIAFIKDYETHGLRAQGRKNGITKE